MTTTPAPLTAERLASIRRAASVNLQIEGAGSNTVAKEALRAAIELCDCIDALTVRIAELEQTQIGLIEDRTYWKERWANAAGQLEKTQAELAAARKPPEDEELQTTLTRVRFSCGIDTADRVQRAFTQLSAALKEVEEKFQCELRRANDYQDNLERVGNHAKDSYARALAAEAKLETARRDALEKAAKIADEWATLYQRQLGNGGPAAAIRALQQKDIVGTYQEEAIDGPLRAIKRDTAP